MLRRLAIIIALLPQALAAQQPDRRPEVNPSDGPLSPHPTDMSRLPLAAPLPPAPRVGEAYRITRVLETRFSRGGSSQGNSYDRDAWIERVIAVRGGDVEVEYDLPPGTTAEDRAQVWQYPVRVLRRPAGPLQLLNGPELEARVTQWLERAHWPRSVCGHWIFTWNEFQIQCDPASVPESLAAIDLTTQELKEGAPYRDQMGLEPGFLGLGPASRTGLVFVVELAVDPEVIRRAHAASEAAAMEIMGDRPELRAMRAEQAPGRISGTIRVRFEADGMGRPLRRTRVLRLEIEQVNGERETRTITETIERRLVPPPRS